MELIDKAAVVAEINKLKGKVNDSSSYCNGWQHALRTLEMKLNTLEVKEVNLKDEYMVNREIAREKSILDETKVEYFATGKPTIAAYSEDNLRNQFDAGADWMKEQIIKALR